MSKSRVNKSNLGNGYTGDLATPIYEPAGHGHSDAEVMQRIAEQLGLKLNKLFEWYAIDPNKPDAGLDLALKLAMAHVPGMQVVFELSKRGRKRTWKDGLASELVRDVATLQQTKKMSSKKAIEELREDKEKQWGTYTNVNLITRHREARKHHRRLTEQLLGSPLWKLAAKFGRTRTDENSSDQN